MHLKADKNINDIATGKTCHCKEGKSLSESALGQEKSGFGVCFSYSPLLLMKQ